MMPEMDGIEAVRIIRRDIAGEYAHTVPIIALTANALIGNDKMFLENGFHDYLTKPIDMAKLDIILNKWVRNRQKEESPEWVQVIEKMRNQEEGAAGEQARAGKTGETPSSEKVFPIEGVDFTAGVKRLGNRKDAYIRVLTSFAANMPALLNKIRDFSPNSLKDYTITIHGIKGSSYGICADTIGKQAEALEMAAKGGDIETIIAKNDSFILEMEKLIGEITKYVTSL
jgi:CheY-like chemotaxis protein